MTTYTDALEGPIQGMTAKVMIEIDDPLRAFDELSNRLYCEGQVLAGLSDGFFNGFGHAFDSTAAPDTEEFIKEYARWQPDAQRHGTAIDLLIERQGITKSMVDALHQAYLRRDRAERGPVGRHVDIHRKGAWDDALAAYQQSAAAVEAAEGDEATDAAANIQHEKLRTLAHTRVPDLDALREKVRIMRAELGEKEYNIFSQIMADIDHIN